MPIILETSKPTSSQLMGQEKGFNRHYPPSPNPYELPNTCIVLCVLEAILVMLLTRLVGKAVYVDHIPDERAKLINALAHLRSLFHFFILLL